MTGRPTSKDVARLAGVSRTTVSYVINHKSGGNVRISDETRRKVWQAVKTLNYHPSSAARALRTNRSNLLAIMIPRVENPFYPHFASAIQHEAEKEQLDVMIFSTHNDRQREKDTLNVLLRRSVDGLVAQSFNLSGEDFDAVIKAGTAVVIHGREPSHPLMDNIMLEEARAVEEAITHLIKKGHRRIATIALPETLWTGRLRKEGYINALKAHNIPIEDELIRETRFRRGYGAEVMAELLALPEPPTAVFAANDLLAIEALLYAIDLGLSVPDDIAVIGFDNVPEATMVRPRLTTIHKDIKLLATTAVQMLVERINSEEPVPSRKKLIGYEIIYRESA